MMQKSPRIQPKRNSLESLRLEFWTALKRAATEHGSLLFRSTPRAQRSYEIRIGRNGYTLALTASSRRGGVACELYISHPQATAAFERLREMRSEIEIVCGRLRWLPRRPGRHGRRILQFKSGDIRIREDWPKLFRWLERRAEKFYDGFYPLLREIKPESKEQEPEKRRRRDPTELEKIRRRFRDRIVFRALRDANWKVIDAANALGVHRTQL